MVTVVAFTRVQPSPLPPNARLSACSRVMEPLTFRDLSPRSSSMSYAICTPLLRLISLTTWIRSPADIAYCTVASGAWAAALALLSANATRMDRQLFFGNDVAWRRLDRFIGVLSPGSYGCAMHCIRSEEHTSELKSLMRIA